MENESYRWHYDYTGLAWEAGFCFENHKSKKVFDRNAIAVVDVERIIRERDIAIVDKYVENILGFALEPEEMRVLDPNFVKIFRLSQLSVEFLMYCKKFLDKTVVNLKNDLQTRIEENEAIKQETAHLKSENHKLKKRMKDLKTTLRYQQKFGPPINMNENVTIYQCHECGKAFINNEFLNSHLKRRHEIIDEKIDDNMEEKSDKSPEESSPEHERYKENVQIENERLQSEIKQLKEKLNNAERYFFTDRQAASVSPEHGTVKLQRRKKHSEYSLDIVSLQHQFELLKTQIESELQLLKSQKLEHDKYDDLIKKIFSKMSPALESGMENKILKEEKEEIVTERRNSYTQTNDEEVELVEKKEKVPQNVLVESQHNSPIKTVSSPQRRPSIQKVKDSVSHFIKIESPSKSSDVTVPDIHIVQEEMERKLHEKTKQEIEQLSEQINEQMSNTFNKLEERMESFWNRLNQAKVSANHESETPTPKQTETTSSSKHSAVQENAEVQDDADGKEEPIEKAESVVSDSVSETESHRMYPSDKEASEEPTPAPRERDFSENVIKELKNKIEERKSTENSSSQSNSKGSKIKSIKTVTSYPETKKYKSRDTDQVSKPVVEKKSIIENPVVKKVYSQPVKYLSASESESVSSETESETGSSSEVDIQPTTISESVSDTGKKIDVKTSSLEKISTDSVESDSSESTENVYDVRKEVIDKIAEKLKELGIDPDAKGLQKKIYQEKTEMLARQRSMAIKRDDSLLSIRTDILQDLETEFTSATKSEQTVEEQPQVETKSSKFKSLISTMKSKAKSLIKHDKTTPKSTPVYKLMLEYDSPEKKIEKVIKPREKSKPTRPRQEKKPVIKPKKMYTETDEESESEPIQVIKKPNKILIKNADTVATSLRKSRSVSTLESESEKSYIKMKSMQNIAKSISNLDSILELKKEISVDTTSNEFIVKKPGMETSDESEESFHQKASSPHKTAIVVKTGTLEKQSDNELDSDTSEENNLHKGSLKNYPSTSSLVKKKVLFDLDSESKSTNMQMEHPKQTLVKSNPFFSKDGDTTSTSSSILDGSKSNLNQPSTKKVTKAIVNVPAKESKKDDESDWDISDIIN